jgi:hypothetical protein
MLLQPGALEEIADKLPVDKISMIEVRSTILKRETQELFKALGGPAAV